MTFRRYAEYYDIFYGRKNYKKECEYLNRIFRRYLAALPKTILDCGCGTGNHAVLLARQGYSLAGLDASEDMLRQAKRKSRRARLPVAWHKGRLQDFNLRRKFDVVICMFSAIDYLLKDSDLRKFFKNVLRHLKKNGLFVFDFWNEDTVNRYYSPRRRKTFPLGHQTVERVSETKIFPRRRLCEVRYTCRIKKEKHVLETIKEKHTVRYFSIKEMKKFLKEAGWATLSLHPFLNLRGAIKKNSWDITAVARKVSASV